MSATSSATARSSVTYCLDAGVLVRRFEPGYPEVRDLWARFRAARATLVAPILLRYEITNAFHRIAKAGEMTKQEARTQLSRALETVIEYHDDSELNLEAADIAVRHGLPATYDAHYLALAQRLGVDLWTTDAKLAKAVGGQLPWVRLAA
ncbi:MAG: type II toxin-antitoxin system VapC family toxin [Micromonosporaceae bacterium]